MATRQGCAFALGTLLSVTACGDGLDRVRPEPRQLASNTVPAPAPTASTAAEPSAPNDPELEKQMAAILDEVSAARQLAPKTPVRGSTLARAEVVKLVMTKTEKELPKGVLEAQGELLRGMGLITPGYDFVGGIYGLIQDNLAGFYDQHEDRMFILDDLDEDAVAETLAHELVHALQDQHFDLAKMLKYSPGDSDRVTAGHALAEGDAMSAMFEFTMGDARKVSVRKLRLAMVASVAFSGNGSKTPRVLQASLIAPYIDGFRFVQELRERGGWAAVDDAYRHLPTSTEQLLHVDKFISREAPVVLPEPALPDGFEQRDHDVLGEQGMRMIFEQWATNQQAADAASGWGGDRFAIGSRKVANGTEWASAWVIQFDNAEEAAEAAKLIAIKHPACEERKNLGPLAWAKSGKAIAIAAGPYERLPDGKLTSRSSCNDAKPWLTTLLSGH